ncbi:hypothetical protein [Nocardioides ochotonae]|uniref:hypothetical protein n=1 Tax=Nocardioides ochotonae TaxID=2685869 RepID=UPI001409B87E|nr:hypothetical protein [Nocardioides ochotonae]
MAALLTGLTLALPMSPASADADEIYQPYTAYNGNKIYLSSAWHTATTGARGECALNGTPRSERAMARAVARGMAGYFDDRGYRTRVGLGTPDENTGRSNGWGSKVHMPLHSNAQGSPPGTCANRTASIRGTWQIQLTNTAPFPTAIKNHIDGSTPGTNDRVCAITVCTSFSCLVEICDIDAPRRSYSETEFHDWNNGVQYLTNTSTRSSLAYAIDSFLGFPR